MQGVSEWLPISSKTQIIIVSNYFYGLAFPVAYAFGLFLEVGTFFAAVVYFRKEVLVVLKAVVGKGGEEGRMLLRFLLVVTAVTAVIGVAIYKVVAESVSGPVLGVPMIALGLVLIVDGFFIRLARREGRPKRGLAELGIKDFIIIGIAQGIAALPGVSRSGATVSTMLLLGVKPTESFRLSFLALIPASVGAAAVTVLVTGVQLNAAISTVTIPVISLAILVTIAVGLVLIRALLRAAGSAKISLLTFFLGALAIFGGIIGILYGTA